MKLSDLKDRPGARKFGKRVGRGIGSGKGKTAGRGVKGQWARSGVALKGFEGGQMPLHRRLPKRGFNPLTSRDLNEINLGRVQEAIDAGKLDAGTVVDVEALVKSGALRRARKGVRLLGMGELTSKVSFKVAGASKSAVAAVEKAGGTVTILEPRPEPGESAA
jgi:large subunit ribosomal protein L15